MVQKRQAEHTKETAQREKIVLTGRDNVRIADRIRRCAGLVILCAFLGAAIYYGVSVSNAASTTVGTVATSSSPLNVRSGPGTQYSLLGTVSKGSEVTITGEENGWYRIIYDNSTGYVSKTYISNVHTVQTGPADEDYIQSLVNQGFPRSYAQKLETLHKKYPNWVFQPVNTGLDWNTVISEESELPLNMVYTTANDAQKSTVSGAYDWATNSWTILDGTSWVAASKEMVAYCMDPRNFLDETNIFQFETLEYASYQSVKDVQNVLSSTFMSGTLRDDSSKTYAQTFMEAGKSANVNPVHLATRCRQEQGMNGTSPLISGSYSGYEGLYNYFNIGAYGTPVSVLYQRGLTYARKNGWTSVYKSIVGGSTNLGSRYIKLGQNTLYFQKFNVVNSYSGLYRHQYMANVQAAISEGKTMGRGYTDKTEAFVFRIPVYQNMPDSACTMPTSGNPNNWLKSMTVAGQSLTPSFSGSTTEYSMIVSSSVSSISVSAAPVVSTTKVSGTGTVTLSYGTNAVKITATAENGDKRTYTISVVRKEEEKPAGGDPTGGGTSTGGGTATVKKGDVNGDGSITLLDLVKIKRHILGFSVLTGDSAAAADVNGDGSITLLDLVKVKRHILGFQLIN